MPHPAGFYLLRMHLSVHSTYMSIFREIKIKLAEYLMNNAHEQPITHTDSVEITEITHL